LQYISKLISTWWH